MVRLVLLRLFFKKSLKPFHFKVFLKHPRNYSQVIHSIHSYFFERATISGGETKKFFCRSWS